MVHNNSVYFRQNNPNFVTLPQYFKQQGYRTIGIGKVFHQMNIIGDNDNKFSWTEPMQNIEDFLDETNIASKWVSINVNLCSTWKIFELFTNGKS